MDKEKFNEEINNYLTHLRRAQRRYEGKSIFYKFCNNLKKLIRDSISFFRYIHESVKEKLYMSPKRDIKEEVEKEKVDSDAKDDENTTKKKKESGGIGKEIIKEENNMENQGVIKKIVIPINKIKIKKDVIDVIVFMDSYLIKLNEREKKEFKEDKMYEKYKMVMRRYIKTEGKL